jgi:type IV pilus assembly protein PilB
MISREEVITVARPRDHQQKLQGYELARAMGHDCQPANAPHRRRRNIHPLALIKERGLIDDLQYEEVTQEQGRTAKPINQILADFGLVDIDTQLQVMAEHLGTEVVTLDGMEFPPELIKAIPTATARMYQCVPVADYGSALRVALANPLNPSAVDEISYIVGKEIQPVVADPAAIDKILNKYFGEDSESVGDILAGADTDL